jgi:guanylate kinase
LIERLKGRGTDSDEKIIERINKAAKELDYAPKFDVILKNDDLHTACSQAEDLILNFINKE